LEKIQKIYDLTELKYPKGNTIILDSFTKCKSVLDKDKYKKVLVSVSGGADSDIMLDLVYRLDINNKCDYIWLDTGLEFGATKEQIDYLCEKYKIDIIRYKAPNNIIMATKKYGQPFLSKQASGMIEILQKMNFKFEDKSYEELCEEYLTEVNDEWQIEEMIEGGKRYVVVNDKYYVGTYGALKWWCNQYEGKMFNISSIRYLKEFMIENPPKFKISDRCCKEVKKHSSKNMIHDGNYDLLITGIRKAEHGIRSRSYKYCMVPGNKDRSYDIYMPLFWYTNSDKELYEIFYNISHSRCYTEYGYKRTGCVACPFAGAEGVNYQLKVIKTQEPNLYKAAKYVFAESYSYTKEYYKYVQKRKKEDSLKKKKCKRQII